MFSSPQATAQTDAGRGSRWDVDAQWPDLLLGFSAGRLSGSTDAPEHKILSRPRRAYSQLIPSVNDLLLISYPR